MKENRKPPAKQSPVWFVAIAYASALAIEYCAILTGKYGFTIACGNTTPSLASLISTFLALTGIITAIIGLFAAYKHSKMKLLGGFVLALCLVLTVASILVQVRIC